MEPFLEVEMRRGIVVIGETPCAPSEHGVGHGGPTCIWLGEPADGPVAKRRELQVEDPATQMLSFREALALLKVSRNTLYRQVHAGKIPGVRRVGRAWRFHRASLIGWLSCSGPDTRRKRRKR